jgi:asparagine synthase (glutamine-hydrolysing)
MCGIAGVVSAQGGIDPAVLQRVNDRLAHRGPDGEGFMLASGTGRCLQHSFYRRADSVPYDGSVRVGLSHRRLAILDLSDRGLQPMCSEDGGVWLVFNGEIYNYRSLRSELKSRRHRFRTETDTEVLLHAYTEWGADCITRLDGMFAFAIWDGHAERLFCARDRLGIKPFYYASINGSFVFASEIKALTAFPFCRPEVDHPAAVGFLVHGNCDYAERTLLRGISALPAAHTITVCASSGAATSSRYWELNTNDGGGEQTDEIKIARLKQSLMASVTTHLISDVRAGSCLSGGLDSSTLVGLIGRIRNETPELASATGERLQTFTSCYEARAFDEREYALAVAQSVNAEPHLVFPTPQDFWSDFERMAWHLDMPFGALSFYAQWRVMRAARDAGVKVLIDGQGGDEVFGGYAKFRYAYLASLLRSGRLATLSRELSGMIRQRDGYVLDVRNGFRYLPFAFRRLLNLDSALRGVLRGDWKEALIDESTPATRWWRNVRQNGHGARWTVLQQIQVDDIVVDTLPQLLRM